MKKMFDFLILRENRKLRQLHQQTKQEIIYSCPASNNIAYCSSIKSQLLEATHCKVCCDTIVGHIVILFSFLLSFLLFCVIGRSDSLHRHFYES